MALRSCACPGGPLFRLWSGVCALYVASPFSEAVQDGGPAKEDRALWLSERQSPLALPAVDRACAALEAVRQFLAVDPVVPRLFLLSGPNTEL